MKKGLILLGLLMMGAPAWALNYSVYNKIMDAVESRDLSALKKISSAGVNMNVSGPSGNTPLCTSVAQGDYEGYEMLVSQGASPYVACMRELPPETVQNFYANQPAAHTYYVGYGASAKSVAANHASLFGNLSLPTLGAGEALIGAGIAGAVIAFGHGSSGGGGGDDPKNDYVWDAPLSLNPKQFSETQEYRSSNIDGTGRVSGVNFLGAINAADAYARGYTGYKISRTEDGSLDGEGESAITSDKVAVAIVDSGVYQNNSKLAENLSLPSGGTYNYVYGVCSSTNTKKCWLYDPETQMASLIEDYVPGGSAPATAIKGPIDIKDWKAYAIQYGNYVYDPENPEPYPYDIWNGNDQWLAYSKTELNADDEEVTKWYLYNSSAGSEFEVTNCVDDDCSEGTIQVGSESMTVTRNTEYDTHGTMVAGLIAASKSASGSSGMMGVAYNAEVIPYKMEFMGKLNTWEAFPAAVASADIVNFSIQNPLLGVRYDSAEEAATLFEQNINTNTNVQEGYRQAALNNKILVFAAGNYTHAPDIAPYDSSLFSMAPLANEYKSGTYNLTNLLVNVVSVTPNGKTYGLASYSAKCGVTKNYCIAAPGGEYTTEGGKLIYSTTYGNAYEGTLGTSFAAPIVSGALAVIKGAFPHLTNQQVVQILLETATDLGEPGVDDVYGHGLVNLAAATDPIGLKKISLTKQTNGASALAHASSASVPVAMAGVAKALPGKIMVLDKYDRGFQMPTSSFVHVAKRERRLDDRFKSFMAGNGKVIRPTENFEMSYTERRSNRYSEMKQGSISVMFKPTETMSFKTYYSENTATSGNTYFERVLMSPYTKMKEAWGANVSFNLGKKWQVSMMGQTGQNGFVNEDDLRRMDHNKSSVFQSAVQYNPWKNFGVKMAAGVATEQGSVLGMWGRGAFKTGNSKTAYVGAGVSYDVTDNFTVEGMYYYGSTQVSKQNSLMNLSHLVSDSFAVTAAWRPDEKRMIGFQFMSPLRIRSGAATVNMPVARDAYENRVYRDDVRASLKPSAREYDMGLYYTDEIAPETIFQTELGVRLNPDHVAGAAPDWRALVGLSVGM